MPSWTRKLHLQRNDRDTSRLWIPKSVQEHRRPHWRPVTRSFESAGSAAEAVLARGTGGALPLSRFGGRPLVQSVPKDPWSRPHCGSCGSPMALFLQLDSRQMPKGQRPFGEGLLQLFYCVSEDPLCEAQAEAFVPFGESTLVRVVPLDGVQAMQRATQTMAVEPVGPNLPCRLITGWVQGEDFPSRAELKRLGLKRSDVVINALDRLFPASVDKTGGWPFWEGFVCYPRCAECDREMDDLVFQIEAKKNLAHDFGPASCAYIFGCTGGTAPLEQHVQRLGFGWAYGG